MTSFSSHSSLSFSPLLFPNVRSVSEAATAAAAAAAAAAALGLPALLALLYPLVKSVLPLNSWMAGASWD